jgi:hypothetical protein
LPWCVANRCCRGSSGHRSDLNQSIRIDSKDINVAKVSLSISGVKEGMSSAEVQQSLARLYNKPETHFEKVSQALFIMQQPYVLLKDVDQEVANKHEKRLAALGFQCDFGDGGLTLVPTASTAAVAAVCPACEKECGNEETCQHCGVFMQKYIKQQKIDEQLQKQLQSASNSHERIQKFQAEQAEKSKELAKAKRQEKLEKKKQSKSDPADEKESEEAVVTVDDDTSDFKAQIKEKRNYGLYGAVAAALVVVGGGGFFAYDRIANRYVSDAPDQIAAAPAANTAQAAGTAAPATTSASQTQATAATQDVAQEIKPTLFDQWTDRKRDQQRLRIQLGELMDEDMLSSASGLVAGKTDPIEQVYGRQELIKLEGESEKTDRKMLSAYMLVLALESDADRVAATLNQSSIYREFNRHDDATKTYDQAAKIAVTVEDPQQRILSETAIAEHHVDYGNLEGARARYQAAKDQLPGLAATPELKTAALNYIAASEVAKGLTGDAENTADQISDFAARQKALENLAGIAQKNEASGVPELAAGRDREKENGTGDEMIDDLIKMTEQNKKKLKAAESLLGK